MGLLHSFSFRHGRGDLFTAAKRSPVIYILRKRKLCNSSIEIGWINTRSDTIFRHRLSVSSSSGSSIKGGSTQLLNLRGTRNKDIDLSEINMVITGLQIPHDIMVIRFHFYLKTSCCICSVLIYLTTVQNKALQNLCQMSAVPPVSACCHLLLTLNK